MQDIEERIKESVEKGNPNPEISNKLWGREIWIVNKEYCGKILELNRGFRCSLHYHKNKDETFLVIKGKVLMESDDKKWVMLPGNYQYIPLNCIHRFSGLENSEIIEFSTHHEESDSYRLEESGKFDVNETY